MSHRISALFSQLDPDSPEVVAGCYTAPTLAHLAQSLSRLVFTHPGGALLLAEGASPRSWADLALREVETTVRLVQLPLTSPPGIGFVLLGLGTEIGFVLAAIPTDESLLNETSRLYDARWSLSPAHVQTLLLSITTEFPDEDMLAASLRFPRVAETLGLVADTLDFAARQHSKLAVTNKALSDRLRAHEDQTRMIVHDMRAPLHTLLISLRALQRQRFDPESQLELLGVASDSAGYLLNLTEAVLDSARLETSGWSLKRQMLNLHALIHDVCEPLELAARPDQAPLCRLVSKDLPSLWLDRGLMERVLTNLITNAIKYTPPHGEIRISARISHDGHVIELSVSDNGQGIPPAAQAHIFERFYQVNDGDRTRGTGLGLYFCRLAVEAHGGSIAVQSAVGQGSTFTMLLPISGEEA
jgi:signal transduction histidine kinase